MLHNFIFNGSLVSNTRKFVNGGVLSSDDKKNISEFIKTIENEVQSKNPIKKPRELFFGDSEVKYKLEWKQDEQDENMYSLRLLRFNDEFKKYVEEDSMRDSMFIIYDKLEDYRDNFYKYAGGGGIGEELMGGQPNKSQKSGYKLLSVKHGDKLIVVTDNDGETKEHWVKNNNYSGYTLHYNGNQYEFANSFKYAEGGGLGNFKIQLDSWGCSMRENSYEEGEGDRVDYFSEKVNEVFDSPKEFFDYLHNNVFYKHLKNEHYNALEDGRIYTSLLVDEYNNAASESEIAAWKKGKKKLYSANYNIYVSLIYKKTPTVEELAEILDIPKYVKGGKLNKYKYIPNRKVESVELSKGKGTVEVDGADVLNGMYVKKGKYSDGGGVAEGWTDDEMSDEKALYAGNKFVKGGGLEQKGKTDKAHDKVYKAKRVGYRYTDERAKKLGLSSNAKPTQEHIDKYLGNGVYKEDRANRSDKSRMKKLNRGGSAGNKAIMQKIQDEVKKLKAENPNMFEKHTDFVKKAASNLKSRGEI